MASGGTSVAVGCEASGVGDAVEVGVGVGVDEATVEAEGTGRDCCGADVVAAGNFVGAAGATV